MFLCPDCMAMHDEPLDAALGHEALCFTCAVEAAGPATDGIFAAAPLPDLSVAA